MAKYLLIAAVLISLVTAGLGYKNYTTLTETKDNLANAQNTVVAKTKELTAKTKELETAKSTVTAVTADKDKASADLAAAESDLSAAKSKLKEATDAAAAKEIESGRRTRLVAARGSARRSISSHMSGDA